MSIQNISLFLPGFLTDLMTSLSKVILVFRPVPLLEWIRNKNRVAQTSDPLGEIPWCRRCVLFTAADRLLPFREKRRQHVLRCNKTMWYHTRIGISTVRY